MKNAVFLDVTPCGSCKKLRFGGTYRFHHRGEEVYLRSVFHLLVNANFIPRSLIVFTLMMEAMRFFPKRRFLQVTRHHTPQDGILRGN
jgi:hypothetical protein